MMRLSELRSRSRPCAWCQSSTIWIMVGASSTSLAFSWSMACRTPCAVKVCKTAWVAPLMKQDVIAAKSAR
ncbi:hypothetical protein D3C81_2064610 [compost metagenome]